MSEDALSQYNAFIRFLIGIISVVSLMAGLFRYKWNQAMSTAKFKMITTKDLSELTKRIDDLCLKIEKMRKEMETEIITSKEEHASMQIKYQELVKELYKLIGQVTTLVNKK